MRTGPDNWISSYRSRCCRGTLNRDAGDSCRCFPLRSSLLTWRAPCLGVPAGRRPATLTTAGRGSVRTAIDSSGSAWSRPDRTDPMGNYSCTRSGPPASEPNGRIFVRDQTGFQPYTNCLLVVTRFHLYFCASFSQAFTWTFGLLATNTYCTPLVSSNKHALFFDFFERLIFFFNMPSLYRNMPCPGCL